MLEAATVKLAVCPTLTATAAGWVVMVGAATGGRVGTESPPPPPLPQADKAATHSPKNQAFSRLRKTEPVIFVSEISARHTLSRHRLAACHPAKKGRKTSRNYLDDSADGFRPDPTLAW